MNEPMDNLAIHISVSDINGSIVTDEITRKDFGSICRLCLLRKNELVQMKSVLFGGETSLVSLMEDVFKLEVEKHNLPTNICEVCLAQFDQVYSFKKQCDENEALLKTLVEMVQEEPLPQFKIMEFQKSDKIQQVIKEETEDEILEISDDEETVAENDSTAPPESAPAPTKLTKPKKLEPITKPSESTENTELTPSFECRFCPNTFSRACFLSRHMRMAHNETYEIPVKKQCDVCLIWCLRHNLTRHKKIHTNDRQHICEHCGKAFIQSGSLKSHLKIHMKKNNCFLKKSKQQSLDLYKCTLCTCVFYSERSLSLHQARLHTEKYMATKKKSYMCDYCGKVMSSQSALITHVRKHKNEGKSCLCKKCGKGYDSEELLNEHMNTSHAKQKDTDTVHKCPICGKTFAYHLPLRYHLYSHSGIKPFKCDFCGKEFVQKSHLNSHKRIHTGYKPHVCPYCNRAFTLNGNLVAHMKGHTGEPLFTCKICKSEFYSRNLFRKHKATHLKDVEESA